MCFFFTREIRIPYFSGGRFPIPHIGYFMSEDQAAAKFSGRRPRWPRTVGRSAEDGFSAGNCDVSWVFCCTRIDANIYI